MQVVCEATQSSSVPVQVGAFECLVKIMTLYYEKMSFYMERALFGVRVLQYFPHIAHSTMISAYCYGHETHGRGHRTAGCRVLVDSL